ncbi:MAG TPA: hypothetical protein VEG25_03210 [Burkholderiales bacterium]|nr:hypothetical protein [Burkholderiales bacterium]
MFKLGLAVLLLGIWLPAVAGKNYSGMGGANTQTGSIPAENNAGASASGARAAGGSAGNQGEQPISEKVIEEHRLGDTAAELDRKRHEREAKCAAEARQHIYDSDCD